MAKVDPELEVLLDALVAMGRDTAGGLAGAGRWTAGQMGFLGHKPSASEALYWGTDLVSGFDYEPSPEGVELERKLIGLAGDTASGLGLDRLIYLDPVQKLLKAVADSPDTLAGLAMGGSLLDVLPGAGLAAAPLAVVKGAKKTAKAKKAIGNVWDEIADYDEAVKAAKQGQHLKRDPKTGQYIGAPRGVDTPAKLAALRRNADKMVESGAYGMDWYDRARRTAERYGAGSPEMMSLFARGGAAYSPQATPTNEIGAFVKQHNAKVLTGEDVRPRTEAQMRNVAKAYDDDGLHPNRVRLGKKTGPYGEAKDPTVPEESLYRTANDIWHGRVMGYGDDFSRGFTPQEHGFLTGENLLLSERAAARDAKAGIDRGAEWNPRSAQAATWSAAREQQYIDKAVAQHEAANAKRKKPKPIDMDKIRADAKAYAASGIDDAARRNTAYVTSEARTGAGVEHLPMSDEAEIDAYTNVVRGQAANRDAIFDSFGLYSSDAVPTRGYFVNNAGEVERNPGFVHELLAGSELKGAPYTPEPDRTALDMSALLGALMRGQETGAWSRMFPQGMGKQRVGDMNAALVRPSELNPGASGAINQAAELAGASPIHYGESTLLTRFDDQGPVPGTTKELLDALAKQNVQGDIVRGTAETGYEPTLLSLYEEGKRVRDPGQGDATENLLRRSSEAEEVIPGFEAKTAEAVAAQAKAMNEIDKAIAAAGNKPLRGDLMKFREILSKGGIPALREYVKQFGTKGLPGLVLGALGLEVASQKEQGDV